MELKTSWMRLEEEEEVTISKTHLKRISISPEPPTLAAAQPPPPPLSPLLLPTLADQPLHPPRNKRLPNPIKPHRPTYKILMIPSSPAPLSFLSTTYRPRLPTTTTTTTTTINIETRNIQLAVVTRDITKRVSLRILGKGCGEERRGSQPSPPPPPPPPHPPSPPPQKKKTK